MLKYLCKLSEVFSVKAKAIILSSVLSIFLSFFLAQNTFAWEDTQENGATGHLVVSPSIDKLGTLQPGKSYTRTIAVLNDNNRDMSFTITPSGFKPNDEGYSFSWGIADSQYSKIADWTNFEPEKVYTLAPQESKKINYTIKVPYDHAGGAQHMMISVKILRDKEDNTMIQTETILNLQVYSNISGELNPAAKLISKDIPSLSFQPVVRTISTIENVGNADLDISYAVTMKNIFTNQVAYEDQIEKIIMPESTRIVEQNWNEAPLLGIFNVYQEITYINEDGEKTASTLEKAVLICPIWLVLIIFTSIVLIIAHIIFTQKKNTSKISRLKHY